VKEKAYAYQFCRAPACIYPVSVINTFAQFTLDFKPKPDAVSILHVCKLWVPVGFPQPCADLSSKCDK